MGEVVIWRLSKPRKKWNSTIKFHPPPPPFFYPVSDPSDRWGGGGNSGQWAEEGIICQTIPPWAGNMYSVPLQII